jgi:hypothetical protein
MFYENTAGKGETMSEIREILQEFFDENVADMKVPMRYEKAEQSILEWARKQVESCKQYGIEEDGLIVVNIDKSEIIKKFSGGGK